MGACIAKPKPNNDVYTYQERDISYRGGVPAHLYHVHSEQRKTRDQNFIDS